MPRDIEVNLVIDSPFITGSHKGKNCVMWDTYHKRTITTFDEYLHECFVNHRKYRKEIEDAFNNKTTDYFS